MAQVGTATQPVATNYQPGQNGILSTLDLDEIREYQKVIQFRDTVVSGKHHRIKVSKPVTVNPQQSDSLATERVAASTSTSTHALPAPNVNTLQMDNMQSFKANFQQPTVVATTGSTSAAPVSRPSGPGKTGANHVSHDKPQDTKARFHHQRQILEEQIKVQDGKALSKSVQHTEHLTGFDLSDILAKALTLVHHQPLVNSSNGTNASDSGDSFDNNTFYSSPHETPSTQPSPRIQNPARRDVQAQNPPTSMSQQAAYLAAQLSNSSQPYHVSASSYQPDPSRSTQPLQVTSSSQQAQLNIGSLSAPVHDNAVNHPSRTSREGDLLTQRQIREALEAQVISSDSGAPSRSGNSGNTDSDQPVDHGRFQGQHSLLPSAHFRQRESPLVRAHDLSPFAPQPAHVSPLAIARHPMPEPEISILSGAPAQVTALRQEHVVVTSPESSPQGDKGGKKKNKKKNKRKAETKAADIPASPEIKPEPRSPSPLSAPQFVRPPKRLRSATGPEQPQVYEVARIDRPVSVVHREQYAPSYVQAERPQYGLEVVGDPYTQVRQSVAPASLRLDRPIYEERRPDGASVQYVRQVQSPHGYAAPYGAVESRSLRSASYSMNPQYREVSTYQRDGRTSTRPYADRARSRSPIIIERRSPIMAPPAPPPARIMVDQYGREYIDPPRAGTISRQSVVPAPRPSEHEIVYERVPVRAPSRMAAETFEENGVIYRRASPTYAPRRVITQPEYGIDYRNYRERDYSVQPLGPPPQDYAPIRGVAERRAPEDVSRDYLPRATSVRPAESVPYYGRIDTVRPEVPPRHYAASVHPEVRAAPAIREFSVRPLERDVSRREFSARPVERYYDRGHADEEVTYIDRPRAAQQEIIYADNNRRQVYQ